MHFTYDTFCSEVLMCWYGTIEGMDARKLGAFYIHLKIFPHQMRLKPIQRLV
jgi:hypothetical protein